MCRRESRMAFASARDRWPLRARQQGVRALVAENSSRAPASFLRHVCWRRHSREYRRSYRLPPSEGNRPSTAAPLPDLVRPAERGGKMCPPLGERPGQGKAARIGTVRQIILAAERGAPMKARRRRRGRAAAFGSQHQTRKAYRPISRAMPRICWGLWAGEICGATTLARSGVSVGAVVKAGARDSGHCPGG